MIITCNQPTALYQTPCLVTAEVLYYMPDYPLLLQSFIWQTKDIGPLFPRIQRFLDFWRASIEADVHSVNLTHVPWTHTGQIDVHDAEFLH
jgi:uncharacterized protein Usg